MLPLAPKVSFWGLKIGCFLGNCCKLCVKKTNWIASCVSVDDRHDSCFILDDCICFRKCVFQSWYFSQFLISNYLSICINELGKFQNKLKPILSVALRSALRYYIGKTCAAILQGTIQDIRFAWVKSGQKCLGHHVRKWQIPGKLRFDFFLTDWAVCFKHIW